MRFNAEYSQESVPGMEQVQQVIELGGGMNGQNTHNPVLAYALG